MKIRSFEIVFPSYTQLAQTCDYLSSELSKNLPDIDKNLVSYLHCRLFYLLSELMNSIGGLLFDSIHANVLLVDLCNVIIEPARSVKDSEALVKLGAMASTFDTFIQNLSNQPAAIHVCNQTFDNITSSDEVRTEFAERCKWLGQLLYFEFFMKPWYGTKPYTDQLDIGLRHYIKKHYPGYHKRIKYLARTIFLKKRITSK